MPGIKVPATVFKDGSAPRQFYCVSCHLLLKDPVQSSCGHRFCKSCADEIIARAIGNEAIPAHCPECQEEFEEDEGVQVSCTCVYTRIYIEPPFCKLLRHSPVLCSVANVQRLHCKK